MSNDVNDNDNKSVGDMVEDSIEALALFDEATEGDETLAASSSELDDIPEVTAEEVIELELAEEIENSELDSYETATVEEAEEFIDEDQVASIVESILFSTERPQSVSTIKQAFSGTNIKTKHIRTAIDNLMVDYASASRGFCLEEVNGGYQMRTKVDNMEYLKRMIKGRPFKLSGPALEVMAIVAYKQPCIKADVDEVRGVESGHLMRGLMEKGMVRFAGKSEAPGKPMLYETTRKFLEIFGLRNLKELPSLSEIDDLIPEGIGEIEEERQVLSDITDGLTQDAGDVTYSKGEDELIKITDQLSGISTSSEFFEQEKQRMKDKANAERAQDFRDALEVEEEVSKRDLNWLAKYDNDMAERQIKADAEAKEAEDEVTEIIEAAESKDGPDDIDVWLEGSEEEFIKDIEQ